MYDEHIYCEEYEEIKDTIIDIANCEEVDVTVEELETKIQDLYDEGLMPSSQYDELMGYIQDLE